MKLEPEIYFNRLFDATNLSLFESNRVLSRNFIGFIFSVLIYPSKMYVYLQDQQIKFHVEEKIYSRILKFSLFEKLLLVGYGYLAIFLPIDLGVRDYSKGFMGVFVQENGLIKHALILFSPGLVGFLFIGLRLRYIYRSLEESKRLEYPKIFGAEAFRSCLPFLLWILTFGLLLVSMDGVSVWRGLDAAYQDIFEGVGVEWNSWRSAIDAVQDGIQWVTKNITKIVAIPFAFISWALSPSIFSVNKSSSDAPD